MKNSLSTTSLPETAKIYLIPQGSRGAVKGVGAWQAAIREDGRIWRMTLAPSALQAWIACQSAPIQQRIDVLVSRLIGAPPNTPVLDLSAPLIMGIINVTPDSFSDGGEHLDAAAATTHGRQLAEAGARILDIGGESTRPGATPIAPDEEIRRVLPVIRGLQDLRRQTPKIALSIDTRHAVVMRAALDAGIDIINDVSALTGDAQSLRVAAESDADIVLMHMQGEPRTMNRAPSYLDVSLDVFDYLETRIDACIAAGIQRRRLIVDPGIGFGKRGPENLKVLRDVALFRGLGCPVLLGASRKGFGDKTQGLPPKDRLPTSLAAALIGLSQGIQILRAHDVAETRQALEIWRQIDRMAGSPVGQSGLDQF
jgi:dihydropteroate synthase